MGIPFSSTSCVIITLILIIIITLIMSSLVASLVLLSVIGQHVNALPYGTDKECWEEDGTEHCCWKEGEFIHCEASMIFTPPVAVQGEKVTFEVADRHLTEEE